ncbi:hypothetical protein LPJ64_000578 [Coemansia asiatica]|uniref:Uncharacterized protein n=1 Tax=Coemansia asiatica TaxID=1052880 RepID=A0A9W7XRM3_9FUNG|nr:hypothetical protein LPJ64_000578 [Coemansia asiatica]KAJ2859582.1 hypothetical protein FB639_005755 [Coemansia asiatica]
MSMSYYNTPMQRGFEDEPEECTCGECPANNISRRIYVRIMYGALQAMHDLQIEIERLTPNSLLDPSDLGCSYPYNWLPSNVRNPRREALFGAHNILLVIYILMQEGEIPLVHNILETCYKTGERALSTSEYIECGGTVSHILHELTLQVEADLRGEACYVDADDLVEVLDKIRPCALDRDLQHWREAIGMQ